MCMVLQNVYYTYREQSIRHRFGTKHIRNKKLETDWEQNTVDRIGTEMRRRKGREHQTEIGNRIQDTVLEQNTRPDK